MNITVLENQKILIKTTRNERKCQISRSDAELLRKVELRNPGIFKWGYDTIAPQQWIGVISTQDLNIEILPKIAESYDVECIRQKLLYMFQVAYDIPTKNNINSRVHFGKNGIVEMLISNFLRKLEVYLQSGVILTYEKRKDNLHAVKGSIVFHEQIRKNALNPTRFICRYSKLTEDNMINRVLKYTLTSMIRISRDNSNIEWIKRMLPLFENVSGLESFHSSHKAIVFNRLNCRVMELIEYCDLFFSGLSVHLSTGSRLINAVLFDMNKLFEQFIYKSYKRIYGKNLYYQFSGTYLLESIRDGNRKIKLRPDMLINLEHDIKMVVDTKWKVVERFVKESDVYQMNAYTTSIAGIRDTVLLYPKVDGIESVIGDYKFNNQYADKILKVRAVDLTDVDNREFFLRQLKHIVES